MGGLAAGVAPEACEDEGEAVGADPVFPAGGVVPDEAAPEERPEEVGVAEVAPADEDDTDERPEDAGAGVDPAEGVVADEAGADWANAPMAAAGFAGEPAEAG